jgi:hypothetical protein
MGKSGAIKIPNLDDVLVFLPVILKINNRSFDF